MVNGSRLERNIADGCRRIFRISPSRAWKAEHPIDLISQDKLGNLSFVRVIARFAMIHAKLSSDFSGLRLPHNMAAHYQW